MDRRRKLRADILICVALVAASAFVYWQVSGFSLLNIDDDRYVDRCPQVQEGLTPANIAWALTTNYQLNWHPLTWVSLMLDTDLGRLTSQLNIPVGSPEAGVYHITNVLLHIANALLLYVVMLRMTGFRWRSAFVAALFALHPLHVESVAWVTERKDVLSTLFWLLTILAYVSYVRNPSVKRYALTAVVFWLGLMAKPMLVTLPLVLLMLDVWPLGRIELWGKKKKRETSVWQLVWEKAVLFAMVGVSCGLTFWAQRSGGAVVPFEVISVWQRIGNAFVSYVAYITTMFWPSRLAVVYPYQLKAPVWPAALSAIALVAASVLACRSARRKELRYIAAGWFWYVVTLIPVIGLVQVGSQARADRYTYVPLMGLFMVVAWGVPDLASRIFKGTSEKSRVVALAIAAILVLAPLTWFARVQAGYWEDSMTLFVRALSVTKRNAWCEVNLASALAKEGDLDGAVRHARRALEIAPSYALAEYTLGTGLSKQGNYTEAEFHLKRCVAIAPNDANAHNNLGALLVQERKLDEAIEHFNTALQLDRNLMSAQHNLGQALAIKQRMMQGPPR